MFNFYPESHNQVLRIRRFLIATMSYLMWMLVGCYCYHMDLLRMSLQGMLFCYLAIIVYNLSLYAVFRSGFNLRFKDPSLTVFQMAAGTLWVNLIVYNANEARGTILMLYMVVLVFGLFRLTVKQFLSIAVVALVNYAISMLILFHRHPEAMNVDVELLNIAVIAMILPWFSLLGGYITHLREKVTQAMATIEKLAIHDDLTQVFNRRQMFKILEREKALGDRGVHPFSICIFDLDHFKLVNDTYGHEKGDIVLKTVAQEIQRNLRDVDHIARYGGEEFILILTSSGIRDAMICAERVRHLTESIVFPGMPDGFVVTISVGVAKYESGEAIQDSINRSDTALYRAKAKGRNRVEYESVCVSPLKRKA